MPIQAFLLLPDQDEVFINIGDTPEDFKGVFDQIIQISDVIHKNQDIDLWYDSQNLIQFLEQIENLFDNDQYLQKPAMLLRTKLKKVCKDWRTNSVQAKDCFYFRWLLDDCSVEAINNNILAEITERMFSDSSEKYLLLNISQSIITKRKYIAIFKDCWHISDLPKFVHIQFVTDADEFSYWLDLQDTQRPFLSNRERFRKTNFHQQGAAIYQDINDSRYWYLDNLHKDHYEVFDSQGNHVGIADLQGNIDTTGKVAGRKIDVN